MHPRPWINKAFKLSLMLVWLITIPLFAGSHMLPVRAQEEVAVKIINPLAGNSSFVFNATEYPIGSTFTMDFYITTITNLVAWQIYVTWNNTVIHFDNASIPENNVFKPATDDGVTLLEAKPLGNFSLDFEGDQGLLLYGVTTLPLYRVTVTGQGLLCKMNFTIAIHPEEGQNLATNVNLIRQPGPIYTFNTAVYVLPPTSTQKETRSVSTESVIVRIVTREFEVIRDIAVENVKVDNPAVEAGVVVTIRVNLQNFGNDKETCNLSVSYDSVKLANSLQPVTPNTTETYVLKWNTTGVAPKTYTILAVVETLPGEANWTNNQATVPITITEKSTPFTHAMWLLSMWLSTPLGTLLIIYIVIIVGIFSSAAVIRRLRR